MRKKLKSRGHRRLYHPGKIIHLRQIGAGMNKLQLFIYFTNVIVIIIITVIIIAIQKNQKVAVHFHFAQNQYYMHHLLHIC